MCKEYIIIILSVLFLLTVPIWWPILFNRMIRDSAKSFHNYIKWTDEND